MTGLSSYIFFSFVCFVIALKSWEVTSWHFGYTNWVLCCPMLFVLKIKHFKQKKNLKELPCKHSLAPFRYLGKTEHLWNSSRTFCVYAHTEETNNYISVYHTGREELLALFQSRGFGNARSFLFVSPNFPLSVPVRHEELLVQGGVYAAMWMKQQKSLDTQTDTQTNSQTQDTWQWRTDINLTNLVSLRLSPKSGATSPTVNWGYNSNRNSRKGSRQWHHFSSVLLMKHYFHSQLSPKNYHRFCISVFTQQWEKYGKCRGVSFLCSRTTSSGQMCQSSGAEAIMLLGMFW